MKSSEGITYIFVCTGKSCKKNGSKLLLKQLKEQKKEKGLKVVKTKCMDHCKKGPNVIVNNMLYHHASIEEILAPENS